MDNSWQFGEGENRIGESSENFIWAERDDLEYVVTEDDNTHAEALEDEQLSYMLTWRREEAEGVEKVNLNKISKELSLEHGYFVTIKAIQTLRSKKQSCVLVGVGGPSGSGKSSFSERVAQVFGGSVIDLENYFDAKVKNDVGDLKCLNFSLLREHLQALISGKSVQVPIVDWSEADRDAAKTYLEIKPTETSVVILEGVYALNREIRGLLDIGIAVVGGVHYDLLQKVTEAVKRGGEETSAAVVMDNVFPQFRTEVEPDLSTAEIQISNKFAADSLRDPLYMLKTSAIVPEDKIREVLGLASGVQGRRVKCLDMYLRPPGMFVKSRDLIRVRQVGGRYFYSEASQRVVDRSMIIRPHAEFEVGKTTLGGLLGCNYSIAVSFIKESVVFGSSELAVSLDTVEMRTDPEPHAQTFLQIRGKSRRAVQFTAGKLAPNPVWITKSYLDLVCESQGLTPVSSPPLSSANLANFRAVSPPPNLHALPEASQSIDSPPRLRRNPFRAKSEDPVESWQYSGFSDFPVGFRAEGAVSGGPSTSSTPPPAPPSPERAVPAPLPPSSSETPSPDSPSLRVELVPKQEVYNFDKGLNMAVSAVQTLLKENGSPVIIGIGGPSGVGKSMFARQLSNLIECQLVLTENYYREGLVDETNYDEFGTVNSCLLQQNLRDLRSQLEAKVPVFSFQARRRVGSREVKVSRENGVVILEGMFALHPAFQQLLDVRISLAGGAHSHLAGRVQRDLERGGRRVGLREVTHAIFPMCRDNIQPHRDSAHLKICNSFDPLHSHENAIFVLKSSKMVAIEDITGALNPSSASRSFLHFTDSYFYLPGIEKNGPSSERDFIRVRNWGNRFSVVIREPIREGDFVVHSQVDFNVSVKTVGGLSRLGYKAAAMIEVNSTFHRDDQLLIEVDHLPKISRSFIQIKGKSKEAVAAAGEKLGLSGTFTTMTYFEIFQSTNKVAMAESVDVGRSPSAAKLQELVLRVNGKDRFRGAGAGAETSPQTELLLAECQKRMARFEERLARIEQLQLIATMNTTVLLATSLIFIFYMICKR